LFRTVASSQCFWRWLSGWQLAIAILPLMLAAVTIARVTFQMVGQNGASVSRLMRCVFVTRSINRNWMLVSAQYMPTRN
jgi:hypothetical protein